MRVAQADVDAFRAKARDLDAALRAAYSEVATANAALAKARPRAGSFRRRCVRARCWRLRVRCVVPTVLTACRALRVALCASQAESELAHVRAAAAEARTKFEDESLILSRRFHAVRRATVLEAPSEVLMRRGYPWG